MNYFCLCCWCQYHCFNSKNHCSKYEDRVEDCPKYENEDGFLGGGENE